MGFSVAGGFLIGFGGPLAGQHKVSLAALRHQIHRDHRKLRGSAALQEQNLVILRDSHDLAQKTFRGINDALIHLGTV